MIDTSNREPYTAATTFAFFGIGNIFQWLGQSDILHNLNTVLSTVSFLVSISVGVTTLVKHYRRNKNK
jgi:hypothetical protein